MALVNSVLSDLSTLETEISLHTEAVLSGRLNEEQLRLQFLQQQQFLSGSSPYIFILTLLINLNFFLTLVSCFSDPCGQI